MTDTPSTPLPPQIVALLLDEKFIDLPSDELRKAIRKCWSEPTVRSQLRKVSGRAWVHFQMFLRLLDNGVGLGLTLVDLYELQNLTWLHEFAGLDAEQRSRMVESGAWETIVRTLANKETDEADYEAAMRIAEDCGYLPTEKFDGREAIRLAWLRISGGDAAAFASALGVSRRTLFRFLSRDSDHRPGPKNLARAAAFLRMLAGRLNDMADSLARVAKTAQPVKRGRPQKHTKADDGR